MAGYLDQKNASDPKKTNRDIFAEERDRVLEILNDPEAMKDRRNEGHEWTLAAMNEILEDAPVTGDTQEERIRQQGIKLYMMQTYMKTIVNQQNMSTGLNTAYLTQNYACN